MKVINYISTGLVAATLGSWSLMLLALAVHYLFPKTPDPALFVQLTFWTSALTVVWFLWQVESD